MAVYILLAIFIANLFSPSPAIALEFKPPPYHTLTTKFDTHFRKYSKRFFGPGFEWKIFKAQAVAESMLNNNAKSWVNAKGIMQIMPRTFKEIKKKNRYFGDIDDPRWNIAAGIFYNNQLYNKWKAERPFIDKVNFMFASYNAGFSTILKAQKMCKEYGKNENLWNNIRLIAPKVRGWRYRETVGYIEKINVMIYEWDEDGLLQFDGSRIYN